MKSFTTATLLAVLASTISAQDTSGCDENYSGTFEIAPYNITQSIPAQGETVCNTNPIVTLKNGVLTDQDDRTGEVVANHQFQFDNPVQGPTTSGFCIYSNGSLALNGNAVFYGCLSGDFSNLYDISIGAQCHEIYIVTFPCAGSDTSSSSITSPSTTSTTSSTPTTTSTTSTSTTPTPIPTTTSTTSTSSTPVAVPATSSTPVASVTPVPFPVGNSTTSAATASAATITSSSSSSSSSSSTTSSTSTTPTTFKGAANIVAVGGKVVAVVAGIAAFALF